MIANAKFRSTIVFLCFMCLYVTIMLYLAYLQVGKQAFFQRLGNHQYHVEVTTKPPRGIVYDRNFKPLAVNIDSLSAFILPKQLHDKKGTMRFLQEHFPQGYERYQKRKGAHFIFIKRRLSKEEQDLIAQSGLQDIHLVKEPYRYYPIKDAGHIIGITDIDNKGMFGIEHLYDSTLSGKPTTYHLERDARSGHYYFAKATAIKGTDAEDLYLTIDGELQFLVQQELEKSVADFGAQEGMVLIIDPMTGDIITMNQAPSFDPNNTKKIAIELTKNKFATETYEFGSVMKIFTALAALSEDLVTLEEELDCQNTKTGYVNGIKINTPFNDGVLPFINVIARSNNIGTVQVAARLSTKLYDHFKYLGFGTSTHSGLMGEQSGFINPPSNWSKRSFVSLSFGYENRATMLQLARAFAMFANGGKMIPLRINQKIPLPKLESIKPLYNQKALEDARKILLQTVTEGSAKKAQIDGYTIMGKTGTANLIENGHYNQNKNIFTFCGILEKGPYKRVIITFIKESTFRNIYAGSVTVPLFERVAKRLIIHDKMLDKGSLCPQQPPH